MATNVKIVDNYDFLAAAGLVDGATVVHKFGHNAAVSTTYVPICHGGEWQTPQVSGATTIRIKAGGNANDTAAGTGARELTIYGCDATGADIWDTVATAGASASSATTLEFLRVTKMRVSKSGTYATAAGGSHAAAITIENGSGGTDWGTMAFTNFAYARSLIGCLTIPLGKVGYLANLSVDVEGTKPASILMFQRTNILETLAPYSPMEVLAEWPGVDGNINNGYSPYLAPIPALTDFGFMGRVTSTTSKISARFAMLLVDEDRIV